MIDSVRWAVMAAMALCACNKSEATEQVASAAPSASAPAEPPCSFEHEAPKFCFEPPAGYVARPAENVESMRVVRLHFVPKDKLEDSGAAGFTIEWSTGAPPDSLFHSIRDNAKSQGADVQDDGKGGFWHDTVKKHPWKPQGYHQIEAHVKGTKGWVSCTSNGPPENDVAAVLAACRSLKVE